MLEVHQETAAVTNDVMSTESKICVVIFIKQNNVHQSFREREPCFTMSELFKMCCGCGAGDGIGLLVMLVVLGRQKPCVIYFRVDL